MPYLSIFLICIVVLLSVATIALYAFNYKIRKFEERIIRMFLRRSDSIPALYEISKKYITRHQEIFNESLLMRKKEFGLNEISKNLEGFIELESHIHHEINFIFQVCNKNPKLLKDKNFLYIRDIFIQKSSEISKQIQIYKKIIHIYNTVIKVKNYTIVGLLLPFLKKPIL